MIGRGQRVGETVEHERRAVVRQRLVHGPHGAARVLATDCFERPGDSGWVVAVIIEHDDAGDLAFELQPAPNSPKSGQALADHQFIYPEHARRRHHGHRIGGVGWSRQADLVARGLIVRLDDGAGPIRSQPLDDRGHATVARVGHERGVRGRVADPCLERLQHGLFVREYVRVIPLCVEEQRH